MKEYRGGHIMYVVCLGVYGRGVSQGALAMDSDRV